MARPPRGGVAAALFPVLLVLAGCGSEPDAGAATAATTETTATPALPPPTLRVAIVTDLKGYLAPCGCTSRPLGGIDRMAAFVRGLRAEHTPTAFLAAGPLFYAEPPEGDRAAERGALAAATWRAEAVVEIWNGLGLDAAVPGALDFSRGVERLEALAGAADFPLLAAGVHVTPTEAGAPPLVDRKLLSLGGVKVGVVGIADLAGARAASPSLHLPDDPLESGRASVAALRAAGAEIVLALAHGDRGFGQQVARLEGVDFVVRGGLDQAEALPPSARGGAFLLHAGHQGQGVLVLDIYRRGPGAFTDASPWTRRAAASAREQEADALEARITAWAGDPSVAAADLETQRARLASMRAEIARAAEGALPAEGNAFVAEWHALDPDAPSDPSVAGALGRFDRRVNQHNREVFAAVLPPPAAPGQPTYVGSSACGRCHAAAYRWWQGHPHGRAYQTLADRNKEFHLDCVGCHVTGYERPGGSNVTHNLEGALTNVGCETCHGPGSQHVADPTATPRSVHRDTPESTCVGCHNAEHSDLFDYAVYRQRLMAPGHGARAGS